MKKKNIGILGSTGSIGTQTLALVDQYDHLQVRVLTANRSVATLLEQTKKYKPDLVVLMDPAAASDFQKAVKTSPELKVTVLTGMDGLLEAASYDPVDILVTALVGMIGLRPTLKALEAGKDLALANKETLVTAGDLVMSLAKKKGAAIYPVDSEHSAIDQCLVGEEKKNLEKLILTASGGPFRGYSQADLAKVTLDQALTHPNWSMGQKITIDSATMMNKGLEVIEAKWLFGVTPDQVDVVVHPQSIVHSMVQFQDGSVMAQCGLPDMKLPILYALNERGRQKTSFPRLDLAKIGHLTFEKPDLTAFSCLQYAYDALAQGGTLPTVLNAANEQAVALFLKGKIDFLDIPRLIYDTMDKHQVNYQLSLDAILEAEREAIKYIESRCK